MWLLKHKFMCNSWVQPVSTSERLFLYNAFGLTPSYIITHKPSMDFDAPLWHLLVPCKISNCKKIVKFCRLERKLWRHEISKISVLLRYNCSSRTSIFGASIFGALYIWCTFLADFLSPTFSPNFKKIWQKFLTSIFDK